MAPYCRNFKGNKTRLPQS